jgi:hypothetical protein
MRQLRSYIVRIYRQGARTLTGIVEDPRTGAQRPFETAAALWDLLRAPTPRSVARASSAEKPVKADKADASNSKGNARGGSR